MDIDRAVRRYRRLLHLYPASFREEYAEELSRIFQRQLLEREGFAGRAALWISTALDTVGGAIRQHLDVLGQDLRQGSRSLRRSPGFALATVAVTALGVGATTAAFTLMDHVLLRPLPFPDPDRLVKIVQGLPTRPANLRGLRGTNEISPALYTEWKSAAKSFSTMGAYGVVSSNLGGVGEPERLDGAVVTAGTFETLGVPPARGRSFTAEDDAAGAPCSVLISDGLWQRRFGGEPSAVGRRVRIDDELCEVVGVMPRGFYFPTRATTFWRPTRYPPEALQALGNNFLRAIARLRPGTSFEQARVELTAVSANALQTWPKESANVVPVMLALRDEISDQSRMLLLAMAGAAACLLLIACTNLANLMIARATARRRELALRTVLGAGQRRLVRQLLTESLVLALMGGGLGLLTAVSAIPIVARLVPTALPIAEIPGVDLRMLGIAAVATLGTGLAFGMLPAFRAVRRVESGELSESSRTGAGRASSRMRDGLVILQVATSIVLLVGAGLLVRALLRVQATPAGFNTEHVITARTFLPWSKYGEQAVRVEFYRRVLADLTALPGVTAAAYTSYLPFTFRGGVWDVTVPGRSVEPGRIENASARFVTPAYFRAMGIPVLAGRTFEESDSMQSQPVAIVSQSFVNAYLEGRQPLGQTFRFGPAGERAIVGVVGDVRFRGLEVRNEPQVYLAYQQQGDNRTMGYTPKDLVVRANSERGAAALETLPSAIRRIVSNADRDQPISDVQPLSAILDGETTAREVQVRVLSGFAAVSCLLAGVGLHGLLAFVVSRRTREFGVRLALGAERRQILALVARRGLALGALGAAAGVWVAYAAGRWIESLLAGLSPADPVTLAGAVVFSLAMTLAGSLLPALRAARINPKQAMEVH
jgi:putative ABC transport system permease protein